MTKRERILAELESAIQDKSDAGRVHYGPEWAGDRPAVEAHDDALDVLVYLTEEIRQHGNEAQVTRVMLSFTKAIQELRRYLWVNLDQEGEPK